MRWRCRGWTEGTPRTKAAKLPREALQRLCLSSSNGTAVERHKPLYMLFEEFMSEAAKVNV